MILLIIVLTICAAIALDLLCGYILDRRMDRIPVFDPNKQDDEWMDDL